MPGDGQPVTVTLIATTSTHERYGWILVPIQAYGDQFLNMILDTRLRESFISEPMRDRLVRFGFLRETPRDLPYNSAL